MSNLKSLLIALCIALANTQPTHAMFAAGSKAGFAGIIGGVAAAIAALTKNPSYPQQKTSAGYTRRITTNRCAIGISPEYAQATIQRSAEKQLRMRTLL